VTENEEYAPFWGHVEDLRKTLLRMLAIIGSGSLTALLFYKKIFTFLTASLSTELVLLGPTDGLIAALKVAFWVGLATTSPLWTYTLLQFLLPAMNHRERHFIFPFLLLSFTLVPLGLLFAYFFTIPLANQYLFAFNESIGVNCWSFTNYLDYTVILLLGHALAFEAVAALLLLVHLGAITATWLASKRRYFIILAFIIGAILTPPDIISQACLALPLIGFYELAILYGYLKTTRSVALIVR